MEERALHESIAAIPAGAWAVAVSGGADSVALLRLLCRRSELSLHVVHLDHETRGGESTVDAAFVGDLAKQLGLPFTISRRGEIEPHLPKLPANRSARFRAARMELFQRTVQSNKLKGVILAHHEDDQAETIFQRLLRGAGPTALAGMSPMATVSGLTILRPLLNVRSADLREFLREIGQKWREDSSNTSNAYLRNRLRPILAEDAGLRGGLLELGKGCERYRAWLVANAPKLPESFDVNDLASLPSPLARHAAGRWLARRGVPVDEISGAACERLVGMCADAATAARQNFPGGILVRRRGGRVFVE